MRKLMRVFWLAGLVCLVGGCATSQTTNDPRQREGLEPLMAQAQEAYSEGRMTDAERHLHEITERFPDVAPAWLRLGNVFYRTGKFDAAVHAYEQALRHDQKNGHIWHNLALTRMQQASALIDSGLRNIPDNDADREALLLLKKTLSRKQGKF